MTTSMTYAETTPATPPGSRGWVRPAALTVGLLALTAALAALGGWWWWKWWAPAPHGEIYKRQDGTFGWYADPLDPGQAHVAASTFEFVVAGFVVALVAGVLIGVLGRNHALLALVVAAAGAALGAFVMWRVGTAFSPADPSTWANAAHYGKKYSGALSVSGWTPYLAWPVGTLLGFLGVMLAITSERKRPAQPGSPSAA